MKKSLGDEMLGASPNDAVPENSIEELTSLYQECKYISDSIAAELAWLRLLVEEMEDVVSGKKSPEHEIEMTKTVIRLIKFGGDYMGDRLLSLDEIGAVSADVDRLLTASQERLSVIAPGSSSPPPLED